ncbi:N-acetylmannosamine-6-phosphate 2-epimerase [candidate division KSB1 bacterium]
MGQRVLDPIEAIRGRLVVSCQAEPGEPLDDPGIMAGLAHSAALGDAGGIRAREVPNIQAIRRLVDLPIIGIEKTKYADGGVLVTEDVESGKRIAAAGADIIAVDVTNRPRPNGTPSTEVLAQIIELGLPVMADVSSVAEGIEAEEAGAALVATTLAGYFPYDPVALAGPPNVELVSALVNALRVPVVAEGRYRTPDEVVQAFEAGAWAVVIGEAITKPIMTTRRFTDRIERMRDSGTRTA